MPNVSVIIPTRNRPALLARAIQSVRAQTYRDWELVVVDDASEEPVCDFVATLGDNRIRCFRLDISSGGGAARNAGIRAAKGTFIAFLDDDDEWVPEKLLVQMSRFATTGPEVGFCFSSVTTVYDDHTEESVVEDGILNHFERALRNPKGYLTVTLIVKRPVFDVVGYFDESFPSHQEAEFIVRVAKRFLGLGINRSLVSVNMHSGHAHIGGDIRRRILGREMLINKHKEYFLQNKKVLASHYFQLGLWYRSLNEFQKAQTCFWQSFILRKSFRNLLHFISMSWNGFPYRMSSARR